MKRGTSECERAGAEMRAVGSECVSIVTQLYHTGNLPPWAKKRCGELIRRYHAATAVLGRQIDDEAEAQSRERVA